MLLYFIKKTRQVDPASYRPGQNHQGITLVIKLHLSVCLSEAFKLQLLSCPGITRRIAASWLFAVGSMTARIRIRSARFALHPLAGAKCEFTSKMKCWGVRALVKFKETTRSSARLRRVQVCRAKHN
jgi:hypothetical protein